MAQGDISNTQIDAAGTQATLDIEGLDYSAITGIEADKAVSLGVTSEGYTGTTLGTKARTLPCTFVSAEAAGDAAVAVLDNFDEASDTALASHTPDTDAEAGGWTEHQGSATVEGGTGLLVPASTFSVATIDAGVSDCEVRGTFYYASVDSGNYGFIFRWQDADNHWIAVLDASGADFAEIRKKEAGTWSVVESSQFTVTQNEDYALRIILSGSSIKLYVNGSLHIDITSSFLSTQTRCGIFGSDTVRYKEFTVDQPSSDARVTLGFDSPVHDDDTATLSAAAGAFSDGSNTSNAASEAAATNGSTNDYPVVSGRFGGFIVNDDLDSDYAYVEGSFDAEAIGFSFYSPDFAGEPLAAVRFTLSDGVNADVVATASAISDSSYADDRLLDHFGADTAYAKMYAASLDPSTLDGGELTLTIEFFPQIGDADATDSLTRTIYYNKSAEITTTDIYVDAAAASGGDGSEATPYDTLADAVAAMAGTTASTRYRVFLAGGTYMLTESSQTARAHDVPVEIRPAVGASPVVTFDGGFEARFKRIKFFGITTDLENGGTNRRYKFSTSLDEYMAWLQGSTIYRSTGRDTQTDEVGFYFNGSSATIEMADTLVEEINAKVIASQTRWMRNCHIRKIGEDLAFNVSAIIGSVLESNANPDGGHPDGYQSTGTAPGLYNVAMLDVEGQILFSSASVTSGFVVNFLGVHRDGTSNTSQWGSNSSAVTMSDTLFANVTLANQKLNFFDDANTTNRNVRMVGSVLEALGGAAADGVLVEELHSIESDGDPLWTDGVGDDEGYDAGAIDFMPSEDSPLLGQLTLVTTPADLLGQTVPTDGTGDLGALQFLEADASQFAMVRPLVSPMVIALVRPIVS